MTDAVDTRFRRIASGDYETADGRYRCYQIPGVRPAAWNVEAVWTDEEFHHAVDITVGYEKSELVVEGAGSYRDAKFFFARDVAAYDARRREVLDDRRSE